MLPSLFKNSVIKKHKVQVSQYNLIPDPLENSNNLDAVHLKKPKLSNAIAIIIVAIMVTAAPVTFELISPRSTNVTLPLKKTRNAPIAAGMASFNPLGLHNIRTIVKKNEKMVKYIVYDTIHNTSLSNYFPVRIY